MKSKIVDKLLISFIILIGFLFIFSLIIFITGTIGEYSNITIMTNGDQTVRFFWNFHGGSDNLINKLQQEIDLSPCTIYEDIREKSNCKIWPIVEPFKDICDHLKIKYIGDYIKYPVNYLVDMDMNDIKKFYSDEQIDFLKSDAEFIKNTFILYRRSFFIIGSIYYNIMGNRDPLIYERNKKVVSFIADNLYAEKNILVIYGKTHQYDMIDRMKNKGFRIKKTIRINSFR